MKIWYNNIIDTERHVVDVGDRAHLDLHRQRLLIAMAVLDAPIPLRRRPALVALDEPAPREQRAPYLFHPSSTRGWSVV